MLFALLHYRFMLRNSASICPRLAMGKHEGWHTGVPLDISPSELRESLMLLLKFTPIESDWVLSLATGVGRWAPGTMESIRIQTFCWRWGMPLC